MMKFKYTYRHTRKIYDMNENDVYTKKQKINIYKIMSYFGGGTMSFYEY